MARGVVTWRSKGKARKGRLGRNVILTTATVAAAGSLEKIPGVG
jgi:hypothetical protein